MDALQATVEKHLEMFHSSSSNEQKSFHRGRAKLYDAFMRWLRRCELDLSALLKDIDSLRAEYEPDRVKLFVGANRVGLSECMSFVWAGPHAHLALPHSIP